MQTINIQELKEITDGSRKGTVLNVLPSKSHREGHIPNSYNIPFESNNFISQAESLVETKDEPIITYCASKDCDLSDKAAKELEKAGFSDIREFSGGIKEWKESNYDLET